MSRDPAFEDLMTRLRAGDGGAAEEVFHRYTHRLIALTRRRLDHLVRRKVDPEDVLQSAYRSFFRRTGEGQFDLESWDHLWFMLTTITLRKCGHKIEYFRAARRDVQREEPLPEPAEVNDTDWGVLSRDPTPSESARLAETVEQLMKGLNDRERDMLALSLQGYTTLEISARVGRSERTVQRLLQRVRRQLEEMNRDGRESA